MTTSDPKAYWGYLFNPDRSPTELLGALLTGIANYISTNIEPKAYTSIVPGKLASFYQGNYNSLFVETDHSSLSFIYQSLGCNHSLLQPNEDDFAPPSIPALSPRGYIRFQSIQLLLGPEEHWSYLQKAVREFDIIDPRSEKVFPKVLPREAFPEKPDEGMVKWHDMVMDRLKREAQIELEVEEEEGLDDTTGASTNGGQERWREDDDYFSYYPGPQRPNEGDDGSDEGGTPTGTPDPDHTEEWTSSDVRSGYRNVSPRRRSYPEEYIFPGDQPDHHTRDSPSPSSQSQRRRERFDSPRSPERGSRTTTAVTTSGSASGTEDNASETSSSLTPSSTTSLQQSSSDREPSHRSHQRYDISPVHTPDHRHHHHHRSHSVEYSPRSPTYEIRTPAHMSHPNRPAPPPPPIPGIVHLRTQGGPPRANYRGANVRWSNESSVYTIPLSTSGSSAPSTPGSEGSSPPRSRMITSGSARYALPERGRREVVVRTPGPTGRPQIRRLYSPLVGVAGRRYPTEGIIWR